MRKLFFCLFILFVTAADAQNYRLVTDVLPAYYQWESSYGSGKYYKTFALDTLMISGQDTLFLTFASIRDTAEPGMADCLDSEAGSVMGRKILRQFNRTVLFNYRQDSIFIRNNSVAGESWVYYSFANGDYIKANHQQTVYQEIPGGEDSVKVIELMRKDADGNVIEDEVNGKQVLLSKNHGLIKTFDNYLFPMKLAELSLIGYENPETGITNLNAKGVYDFDIGDEFHIESEDIFEVYDEEDSVYKIVSGDIVRKIRLVTGRADFADSVVYQYAECSKTIRYTAGVPDTLYQTGDVAETIIFDSIRPGLLDAYPGQKVAHPEWDTYYDIVLFNSSLYNYHLQKVITDDAFEYFDSCVVHSFFDPCCYNEVYIESCGGPYYQWSNWAGSTIKNKLVYYNKNGVEWGEPIAKDCDDLLSDIHEQVDPNGQITVYPNPFTDELTIRVSNAGNQIIQVDLFDINGHLLSRMSLHENIFNLNTADLSGGIYILEVQFENGSLVRRKVVKSRN